MSGWIPVLTAFTGAGLGAFVTHLFARSREVAVIRRTQRIDYRVRAYRALAGCVERRKLNSKQHEIVETALDDILLFGVAGEIELAQRFMREISTTGGATLGDLLDLLRMNLRKELGAEPVSISNGSRTLRFHK